MISSSINPSHFASAEAMDWSMLIARWESIHREKVRRISDFSDVSTALRRMAPSIGVLKQGSIDKILGNAVLDKLPIIDAHVAAMQVEAERTQSIVTASKIDIMSDKDTKSQKYLVFQFLQFLNDSRPDISIDAGQSGEQKWSETTYTNVTSLEGKPPLKKTDQAEMDHELAPLLLRSSDKDFNKTSANVFAQKKQDDTTIEKCPVKAKQSTPSNQPRTTIRTIEYHKQPHSALKDASLKEPSTEKTPIYRHESSRPSLVASPLKNKTYAEVGQKRLASPKVSAKVAKHPSQLFFQRASAVKPKIRTRPVMKPATMNTAALRKEVSKTKSSATKISPQMNTHKEHISKAIGSNVGGIEATVKMQAFQQQSLSIDFPAGASRNAPINAGRASLKDVDITDKDGSTMVNKVEKQRVTVSETERDKANVDASDGASITDLQSINRPRAKFRRLGDRKEGEPGAAVKTKDMDKCKGLSSSECLSRDLSAERGESKPSQGVGSNDKNNFKCRNSNEEITTSDTEVQSTTTTTIEKHIAKKIESDNTKREKDLKRLKLGPKRKQGSSGDSRPRSNYSYDTAAELKRKRSSGDNGPPASKKIARGS